MAKAKKAPGLPSAAALESVRAALAKKYGKGSVLILGAKGAQAKSTVREVIPTGIDVLDRYVLGIGGLPAGRFSEVYSEEGGGKTSFGLHCLGRAQRAGGLAILADDEMSLDEGRARLFGADINALLILQPGEDIASHSMEASLRRQTACLESIPEGVGPNLMVWDSLAAAVPAAELKGDVGDAHVGLQARIMGQALRKMLKLASKKRTHVMIINQTRAKIGVIFGDATNTPGGKAAKFAASIRLQLFTGASLKNRVGQHIGKSVTFLGTKNRFAPPHRKARVRLMFGEGWDNIWGTVDHAKNLQCIPKDLKLAAGAHARAVAWFTEKGWDTPGDPPKKKGETSAEDELEARLAELDEAEEEGEPEEDDDGQP